MYFPQAGHALLLRFPAGSVGGPSRLPVPSRGKLPAAFLAAIAISRSWDRWCQRLAFVTRKRQVSLHLVPLLLPSQESPLLVSQNLLPYQVCDASYTTQDR